MFQKMIIRTMLERQLKGVPEEQREMLIKGFEKNPDLFAKIAKEVKAKMKEGKDQMTASMEVMQKYQKELRKAMHKS